MARREGENALQNQLHINGGENTRRSNKFQETKREKCEEEAFEIDLSSEVEEERRLWLEHTLINRVVGPRMTRATIRDWISKHWGLRLIVKFIPRSFFIVVFENGRERNKMYNLPMEYWGENCLEKIGQLLGSLLEIDEELLEKDSYIYAQLKLAAAKEIPPQISLVSLAGVWMQQVEIEKDIIPCLRCGSKMHREGECRIYVRKDRRNNFPKQSNKHRWVKKTVKLPLTISDKSQKDVDMEVKLAPIIKDSSKMNCLENEVHLLSDSVDLNPINKEDIQLSLTSNSEYEEEPNPEEADLEDELENLDPRSISQSANIMLGREKGGRGRRSHKQVREERALEKGIVSVINFMKKSKGGDLSLGER
ncbi:hypothetical protein SUGI_1172550 [Cryptomeria japonica]|nr:hypothetical protein SUGI_1172550 [Cryptomeria japonica]